MSVFGFNNVYFNSDLKVVHCRERREQEIKVKLLAVLFSKHDAHVWKLVSDIVHHREVRKFMFLVKKSRIGSHEPSQIVNTIINGVLIEIGFFLRSNYKYNKFSLNQMS